MRVASINTISYRNYTGVGRNSAPVVSHDEKSVSFGAKGSSDKKVWPKVLLAVILLLPLIVMPFANKNKENE